MNKKDQLKKNNNPAKKEKSDLIYKKNNGGKIGGAIILLSLGIIFLLNNFDILPWDFWGSIWRIWPIFLIIGGLSILFRQKNE